MEQLLHIVILAAGLGTRMRSRKAKVLHEAGGKTLVQHVVETACRQVEPQQVTVVVGHQAAEVEQTLSRFPVRFAQQAEQKGTGHALLCAVQPRLGEAGLVVVLYGDCPLLSSGTLERLIEQQRQGTTGAVVITTELDDPTGYGRVIRDPDGTVRAIVEQKAATTEQLAIREINSGIYCFRSDLLARYLPQLKPNPASGEIYLTDLVEIFHRDGWKTGRMLLTDADELLGINTRQDLATVDGLFRERKRQQLMRDGVTIQLPETVVIDADVEIGIDTVIEPYVQLRGNCRLGEDCRIGSHSLLVDATLGSAAVVHPFSYVQDSVLETGAEVGPYARLRLGSYVESHAHVGNFVELKKTRLGSGSKAMHLTYLGDASVGGKTNIGAGTITCNYDGRHKHPTQIGSGSFVGSHSTLIAPVSVQDGSYVAAGSVITDTVPADSLAIARGRQTVKEGWAKRRREQKET